MQSLTKIVAMQAFMELSGDLSKVVTYKYQDEEYNYRYCDKSESARLRVSDGETMKAIDLVHASLVGSANNAVESLARASGVERQAFIRKMNELVRAWGAVSTSFEEPTGLSPGNVSTASDYALISKEALKTAIIAKASASREYTFDTINTKKRHTIYNTNSLIRYGTSLPINGSKTGYLEEAGYCLMIRVKSKSGGNVIITALGADNKTENYSDIKLLAQEWGD